MQKNSKKFDFSRWFSGHMFKSIELSKNTQNKRLKILLGNMQGLGESMTKVFLTEGLQLQQDRGGGMTIVDHWASLGFVSKIDLILKVFYVCDLTIDAEILQRALAYACYYNNPETAVFLLKHGANPNLQLQGMTVFRYLLDLEKTDKQMDNLYVEDVHENKREIFDCLFYACEQCDIEISRQVLEDAWHYVEDKIPWRAAYFHRLVVSMSFVGD